MKNVFRDASIAARCCASFFFFLQRGGAGGGGGLDGRRRKKRHQYEYSLRVGNVVHRILTSQGVNMTLAQKAYSAPRAAAKLNLNKYPRRSACK